MELTFVSTYALLVSRSCWWYPWTTTKVAGIGMGSGELTIKKSPSRKVVIWLDFELDSARTELTDDSPGGRRPCHGETVMREVACSLNDCELEKADDGANRP